MHQRIACGFRVGVTFIVLALAWTARGEASLLTPSPNLPPLDGQYVTPADAHQIYSGPGVTVEVFNVRHYGFSLSTPPPQNVGGSGDDAFGSTIEGDVMVNGLGPVHFTASADVTVHLVKTGGPDGSSLGTFDTEMLQLDLVLPGVSLIRESPTLHSTGQTTIQDAGGGLFQIDSFFDIFTELSLDGGQSWIPASGPGRVNLEPTPEPATLLLLGTGLVGLGGLAWRRSRRR